MFYKIFSVIKRLVSRKTMIIVIFTGLLSLLVDGKRYRSRGCIWEFNIIKLISYSYIIIASLVFILLVFI